jgi:transcriptional regulator with XRE-family HTH domain
MSVAIRIRELREAKKLSLDDLAAKARISKTYLWELEKDTTGTKKPSADVLLRIATALSTTIADLMSLPSVRVQQTQIEIPPSLHEFQKRMSLLETPLSAEDLRDLAGMKFRGGQPQTADEWNALYLVLLASSKKPKK